MTLALRPRRVVDTIDRRVLGAFQFVDALLGLPVAVPAAVEPRGITVTGTPGELPLPSHALRIRPNRRGAYVVFAAPFFDAYTRTFDNPQAPAEAPVSLRLAVTDAGAHYLPQQFELALPRPLDPRTSGSVFEVHEVELLRAPSAPVQDGWAVLRVRVTQAATDAAIPGVLLRVFTTPRADADLPIGIGMTDWRGAISGEALVPIHRVQRFRPGSGPNVIETTQEIEFEATRDASFTGATGQLPNVARLIAGTGLIRRGDRPPGSGLDVVPPDDEPPPPQPPPQPPPPIRVQAGRELSVHLSMA
jgi:hypothetical protein